MSSRATDIKDLLVAASLGTFNYQGSDKSVWSILVAKRTEKQDRQIICYDTGGKSPNSRWLVDYPTVQIMLRGGPNDYDALVTKTRQVRDQLLGMPSQIINGDYWVSISLIGDSSFIGYDKKDRPTFTINLQLIINPATGTHRESC